MYCLRSGQLSLLRSSALLFSGAVTLAGVVAFGESPKTPAFPAKTPNVSASSLPLVFEENAGQLPEGSAFAGRTQNYTVQVRPSELRFGLPGKKEQRTVTLSFTGSQGGKPEGIEDAGFKTNIYIGSDHRNWHTGVRNFDRVALRHLYAGVDAEFYSRGREIEHDFTLSPNADASQLAMHVAGAKTVSLNAAGDLVLTAEEGALRLHKPNAYQVFADGKHQAVEAQFELVKTGEAADLRFKLGTYDHSRALVIDPVITYATYVTSNAGTLPTSILSDSNGNVYLTGTTKSSGTNFSTAPAVISPSGLADPPPQTLSFVANLAATDSGSKIAWITYYGSATAPVLATTSVLGGASLLIGGSTTAADLPVTMTAAQAPYQASPAGFPAGTSYGFVAKFDLTGALQATAYVYGAPATLVKEITTIGGIAVNGTGYTIAGTTTTTGLTQSATPFTYNNFSAVTGNALESKGFLITLNGTLDTASYATYIAGDAVANDPSATQPETSLTGVAVDGSGNIYFAGSTYGDFVKGGAYTDSTVTHPAYTNSTPGTRDVFAGMLAPATNLLQYSFYLPGNRDEAVNGLYLDSGSNLYLYGKTNSSNLLSASDSSVPLVFSEATQPGFDPLTNVPQDIVSTPVHYNANYPADAGATVGWVAQLNSAGATTSSTFLGAGPAAGTNSVTGPANSNTNVTGIGAGTITDGSTTSSVVYVTGSTSTKRTNFPQKDGLLGATTDPGALLGLPTTFQDTASDSDDVTLKTRGFLLQMNSDLTAINYLANLGSKNSATNMSTSVGVAIDKPALGSTSAFVALADTVTTAGAYTTAAAAERGAQVTNGTASSAYVARVAFAAGGSANALATSGNTITPANGSIAYSSDATRTTLTITWNINATTVANNVIFEIPQSPYLATYAAGNLTYGGGDSSSVCKLGAAVKPAQVPPVNANPGFTCYLPSMPAGSAATFTLTIPVTSVVNTALGTDLSVNAWAFDDQAQYLDLTQKFQATGIPTFTVTGRVSKGAGPGTASTASTNVAGDTTDTADEVTYTYTLHNTSSFDSPSTRLVTNLDTAGNDVNMLTTIGSPVIRLNGAVSTCDPTTNSSGCDVPAGQSLTYSVTGVYIASQFNSVPNFPYAVNTAPPTISFTPDPSGLGATGDAGSALSVNVTAVANISQASLTTSTPTYNGGFRLGDGVAPTDAKVQFIATIKNNGPSIAPAYSTTVTLPQGFIPDSSSITTGTGDTASCTSAAPYTCSVRFTNIAVGSSPVYTIAGHFQDTGTAADAVPPPSTASDPLTNVKTSQVSRNLTTAKITGQAASSAANGTSVSSTSDTFIAGGVTVYRENQIATSVAASAPIASDTVNAYSSIVPRPSPNSFKDTVTYTATVSNSGKSAVRGLYFTIPVAASSLPVSGFTMIGSPVASDVTAATGLTCSYTAPNVTCYQNDLTATPPASTTPASYTVTYTLAYDQSLIPTTSGVKTVKLDAQPNSSFYDAADRADVPGATYKSTATPGTAPTQQITVQRSATLKSVLSFVAVKSSVPTTLADQTRLNLDEHIAGDKPGANDTIIITSSTTNSGPNDADRVNITFPLPPFMRVAVPVGCVMTAGTATVTGSVGTTVSLTPTGSTGATMSCTPVDYTYKTVQGVSVDDGVGFIKASASATCAASLTLSASKFADSGYDANNTCFQVALYGKFADTAAETDTVAGTNAFGSVTYSGPNVTDNDVQVSAPTVSFSAISTPSIVSVQRAAHIHIVAGGFPATLSIPKYTDGTAVATDTTITPNIALVGQAANLYNVTTRVATGGKVFDCFRYVVPVVNDGPNYASGASMKYAFSTGVFVPTGSGGGAGASRSPVNCAVTNTAPANTSAGIGLLSPGVAGSVFLDGYFDLGSLSGVNSTQTTFSTLPFVVTDAQESNTTLAVNDYKGAQTLTIGNTPFNDVNTLGFAVNPIVPAGAAKVNLIFTSASQAGITNAITTTSLTCTTTGGVNNCFPAGKSPYPPDNSAVRNLYQPGRSPTYYQVPTTAILPQNAPAATSNPTSVCITAPTGGAFGDVFVKPERVLLWVMKNAATGTNYNSFPTSYPALNAPLTGDVTTMVLPYQVSSYVKTPTTFTFPQVPQAQPGMVCGQVNGLTTTSTVDSTASGTAETLGLLEPVNFPPFVVAGTVPNSASGSKGSTSGVQDIYLAVAGTTATSGYTRDFNFQDPCYLGAAGSNQRQTCDDNPYMYTKLYVSGGGSSLALVSSLQPETSTSIASGVTAKQVAVLYATAGTGLFVAVADQATGADAFNSDVIKTAGYSVNPFAHQGNFLTSASSASSGVSVCDPGQVTFSGYVRTAAACSGAVAASTTQVFISGGQRDLAVAPNYGATVGLNGNYFYLGNVGAQGIVAGSSGGTGGGLIPLPYPDASVSPESSSPLPRNPNDTTGTTPLGPDSNNPTAAIATVTAGGTAGFVWPWLSSQTVALGVPNGALAGDLYDLSCAAYDTATQQQQISFPQGINCYISTSTPGTSASPTVYTFGTSSDPTIFVTTSGSLSSENQSVEPVWKRGLEGIVLAMVLPVFCFRKRLGKGAVLALLLLTLGAAPLLSGCGSGGAASGGGAATTTTPAGGYYLRVIAKPEKPGKPNITSAVFEVLVKSAN